MTTTAAPGTTATRRLLTVRQAAVRLNVSMRTARRLIKSGELPAVKVTCSYRIDPN